LQTKLQKKRKKKKGKCCKKFTEFLLNLTNFFRDFPKMQQFWENPKIAHLVRFGNAHIQIFVLKNI
jgi:hypothetical protein